MQNQHILSLATTMLAIVGVVTFCSCASAPRDEHEKVHIEGEVRVYEVFGMDCPGCHGGLEKLALEIPGVLSAKASWKEQRLTLTVQPDADVPNETVKEAVSRANFTAGERLK